MMRKILKRNLTWVYQYSIYFAQELTDETILSKHKEQIEEKCFKGIVSSLEKNLELLN